MKRVFKVLKGVVYAVLIVLLQVVAIDALVVTFVSGDLSYLFFEFLIIPIGVLYALWLGNKWQNGAPAGAQYRKRRFRAAISPPLTRVQLPCFRPAPKTQTRTERKCGARTSAPRKGNDMGRHGRRAGSMPAQCRFNSGAALLHYMKNQKNTGIMETRQFEPADALSIICSFSTA